MKKSGLRVLSLVLVLTMILGLGACGSQPASNPTPTPSNSSNTTPSDTSTPADKAYDKFITIDMFNSQANYQGIQSGWFGKVIKDRFNMEINIIAPNVAGGGDTLFQTRSAAGFLGDIVTLGAENGRLADTVKAGLLMDITDMVVKSQYLSKYPQATDMLKNLIGSDRIYAIPSQVSSLSPLTPSEGNDLTYGPYLRWDYYMALGAPRIRTLEDLLPILKEMQDKYPTSDSGKKAYAISLFKDWDGNMMCLAKQPACMYGYDEIGFALVSADGKTVQSIIDSDSEYIRSLRFFYEANQLGILDPDSPTQNWDTLAAKYADGAVHWSPWPWQGQIYNTVEHKAEGKGFMIAPMEDMKIFSYGCNPTGNKYCIAVGSKAQDPQRMVDFIDWLYSPEGVMMSCAQTTGSCGPEGLTWEMKDGRPVLTEFGVKAFSGDQTLMMPESWGGGTYKDGISQLNYQAVSTMEINPLNNAPYNYSLWPSYLESNTTPLDKSWKEFMKAETTLDYLSQHNAYTVAPGNNYIPEAAPAEIDTLRNQCREIIKANSWKMVFAANDAEFEALLKDMQDTVKGLGYDEVFAFDVKIAENTRKAREEAIANAK